MTNDIRILGKGIVVLFIENLRHYCNRNGNNCHDETHLQSLPKRKNLIFK
ncbi:hypothetical protein K380107A5_24580 [Holdemania massiliensis]